MLALVETVNYPDMKLWQEIIFLQNFSECLFLIENVKPYYIPLIEPNCKLNRHYFWSNFIIKNYNKKNCKNFIDAKFEDLKKWLGFENFNKKIYINKNHDYTQILRNCVHPETGLHILNCAIDQNYVADSEQINLF
jgi:DNA (cytosine-5)-methyltransferase 1